MTWHPIETAPTSETEPTNGVWVAIDVRDIRNGRPHVSIARRSSNGPYWITDPGGWRLWPTHVLFLPLPDPPKAEPDTTLLPAIPGHSHVVRDDGILLCGCVWPQKAEP